MAILIGMLGDIKLNDEVRTIAFAPVHLHARLHLRAVLRRQPQPPEPQIRARSSSSRIASVLGITAAAILIMAGHRYRRRTARRRSHRVRCAWARPPMRIARLPLSDSEIETLQANAAPLYSISYISRAHHHRAAVQPDLSA